MDCVNHSGINCGRLIARTAARRSALDACAEALGHGEDRFSASPA